MPKWTVDSDTSCMVCGRKCLLLARCHVPISTIYVLVCLDCLREACRAIGEKIRDEK